MISPRSYLQGSSWHLVWNLIFCWQPVGKTSKHKKSTEMQNHSWLGDMCDEVFKVELKTGNTMIIPTGWIHAVVSMFLGC